MAERATGGTLPWWKKALFAASLLALLLVAVDAAAWVGGRIAFGAGFSGARLEARRDALSTRAGTAAGRPAWLEDEVLHPYFGFIPRSHLHGRLGVSEPTPGPPPRTAGDRVVVAVVGGSVANQFAHDGLPRLVERLGGLPAFRGKSFVTLNATAGGYKEPQQLMVVAYLVALGEKLDLLINLDGFNDVALYPNEDAPARVFPAYPRRWHQRVERALSRDELRTMLRRLELEDRRRWYARQASRWPWRALNTTSLVYLALDTRIEAQLTDADRQLLAAEGQTTAPIVATGPPVEFKDTHELLAFLVDLWRRSSEGIHELAAANGVRYYHFLQPNQYVPGSKPIGPQETRVAMTGTAYRRTIEAAFPMLREAGRALRARGVRFHDLTAAFTDHPEPLYVDSCCHVSARGSAIVADRIFDAIRQDPSLR